MKGAQKRNQAVIRAVAYDVDGTMYRLMWMRTRMLMELGLAFCRRPLKTFREIHILKVYRNMQERLRRVHAIDAASGDPQLKAAGDELRMDPEVIRGVVDEWIVLRPLEFLAQYVYPKLIKMIHELHEAGIQQGVYSDYDPRLKLKAFGIENCIDAVVSSGQTGLGKFKPSPEGFLQCARQMGVQPSEVLYIGDRDRVDGEGARAAGMQFMHIHRFSATRVKKMLAMGDKR